MATGPRKAGLTSSATAPRRERAAGLLAPALATLVALAILVGLGAWQWQRRSWKEGLIARIEARADAAPVPLPPEEAWPAWLAAEGEYTRVAVRGRYRPDADTLVHGLMPGRRGQPVQGFYVLTPLLLGGGGTVMVNRGFVPTEFAADLRKAGPPGGEIAVTGLLRPSETRGAFVPENQPERAEWYVRDLGQIAAARGLQRLAPFLVEVEPAPVPPEGWPRPVGSRRDLPNNHLQYALTWFSLALVLVAVFAVFARRRLRGHEAESA